MGPSAHWGWRAPSAYDPGHDPAYDFQERRKTGETGGGPVSPALSGVVLFRAEALGEGYLRLVPIAFTSSPLLVSPLNSQKNAPPRPWFFAHAIFEAMVAGVS